CNRFALIGLRLCNFGGAYELRSQPASGREKPGRPQQPHEIATRNARGFPRFKKEFAVIRVAIDPMRVAHCLRQFSKKRSASGWQGARSLQDRAFATSRLFIRYDLDGIAATGCRKTNP